MPQTFVAPSGREYEWQKDSPPTQADIDAIVAYENEIVAREKAEARRAERPRGLSGKPEPVVEPFRPDPAQIRPQATAGAAAGALAGATGRQPPQLPSFRAAFGSDALKSKAAAKFFDKPQSGTVAQPPPHTPPKQAMDYQLRRAFEERAIVPRQGETQEQFQVRQAIAQKEAQVSDGSVVGAIAGGAAGKKTPQITTIQEQRRRGIEAREVPPEELEQAVFEEMIALPEDELRALVDERRTIWERNKGNYTAFKDYEQAQAALEEKLGLRRLLDPINALRGLQLQAHKAVVRDDIPATERLMALVNTVEGVVTIASLGSKSVVAYPAIHGLKAAGRVLKPALVKALQAAGKYTSSAKVAVERAVKSLDDKNLAAFRNALERLNLTDDQLKPVVDDVVKHVEDLSAKLDDATVKQVEGVAPTKVEGEASGAIQVKQAEVSAEEGAGRVRQEAPEGKELWEEIASQRDREITEVLNRRNAHRDAEGRLNIDVDPDAKGLQVYVQNTIATELNAGRDVVLTSGGKPYAIWKADSGDVVNIGASEKGPVHGPSRTAAEPIESLGTAGGVGPSDPIYFVTRRTPGWTSNTPASVKAKLEADLKAKPFAIRRKGDGTTMGAFATEEEALSEIVRRNAHDLTNAREEIASLRGPGGATLLPANRGRAERIADQWPELREEIGILYPDLAAKYAKETPAAPAKTEGVLKHLEPDEAWQAIESGDLKVGDEFIVTPTGKRARVVQGTTKPRWDLVEDIERPPGKLPRELSREDIASELEDARIELKGLQDDLKNADDIETKANLREEIADLKGDIADYENLLSKYAKEPPAGKEPWEMTREGAKVHISNALDEAETYAKTHTPPAPQWDNELKASIKKAQKQYDDARKAWDRNPMPTEFQVKRLREAEAKLKDLKERGGKAQADNRANDDFFKKKEAEYLLQKYPDMFEARNEWPFYMGSSRYSDLYYHKDTVAKALREGKPVPPEVLADYPDLAAKYAKETPPAAPAPKPTGEVTHGDWTKGPNDSWRRGEYTVEPFAAGQWSIHGPGQRSGYWSGKVVGSLDHAKALVDADIADNPSQTFASIKAGAKPTGGVGKAHKGADPPEPPAPKPTKPAAVIQETPIPTTSKQAIPETTTTPAKKPPTKIQQAMEKASEERVSAYEAMVAARKRAAAQMKRGGKKTGAAQQPILPEEFAYFNAWIKEKGLQGAAAVEQFIIHVKDELGESVAHWRRVLASAPKEVTPKAQPKRSTGLANVVQDQEALEGIIQEVEKGSGKSAKYWAEKGESILSGHESGKAIHAEGDYIALARRIAAEETPATGERIGIILAGKARMLRKVLDVQDTIRKLVDDGADKKLIGAAKRDLEAVETQLADYLTDVQVGKGIWSDVGRAMQGGIDIDYGNYVDVLERFIRSGRKPTEREAKQLSAAVNDYQQYVKKVVPSYDPAKETAEQAIQRHIDEQIQKAKAEYILKEVTGKSKPKSGRSLKEIRKSRETTKAALRSAFRKALKPDIGSGLGSLESLIEQAPEIVRLLKRYIAEWVEERVAIKASAELDDLHKHLRHELPDMLEEGADITDRDIQRLLAGVYDEVTKPQSEVAKQVAELERQSKLLENIDRVTEGDELLLAKTPAESSKKVKRLRTLYNALRVSMGRVDSPPGARDRVEKIIADLDAQLKGDYRNVKTKRVVTNKDLKDQAQSLRKTMRLKDTIYELEDRLRTRNFQKPPKEVKQLTLEQQNLQARADILRDRVRSQLHEANRSTGMKVAHAAASLFRGLKLGQDLGQLRRQGLFVSPLSRTFWVALSKAGKSAFSEEAEHRFLREIEERVLPGERLAAPIRKKAGLSLTTDVVSTEEELSIGRFLSTFKWTRPFARPLERFQRVFINSARADVFDYSVLAGRTDNELLHRARFINNATGRGNVKRVPELLQIVMTSPNYEFSRWGMIGEIPRNPARFLSDLAHGRGVNMGVVDNMRQMATTVGELLGIAGIASMAGYRINLDGDSSDFLKLRKYDDKGKPTDEVWDLTAGIGVRLRDIFRTGKAFEGAEYNKAFDSLIGKTAVRTISPGVRGPVELASVMGQRLKGEEKPTSFFTSFESEETGWSLITPLIWQQAYEAYQRGEPPSRQAFLDALEQYSKELVGTGPQYYKPPQSASTIRIPKELQ